MILEDFHVHTTFSDGVNTPEEMVRAAMEMGLRRIGFSDHAHTPGGESYCMAMEHITAYRETVAGLKEKYRGKIGILCGIEQDLYSDVPTDGYDYVIGSVHALKHGDRYYDVDDTEDVFMELVTRFYDGDYIRMAEDYFNCVSQLTDLRPNIVGHMDLITKFNEGDRLFDTRDPRYLAAAKRAVAALLPTGAAFEINTGAISRKRRSNPYPSEDILRHIVAKGGKLVFSGDAHSAETLCYQFEKWNSYFHDLGILQA
jgi:histidinol-phosphatase (PHP family)